MTVWTQWLLGLPWARTDSDLHQVKVLPDRTHFSVFSHPPVQHTTTPLGFGLCRRLGEGPSPVAAPNPVLSQQGQAAAEPASPGTGCVGISALAPGSRRKDSRDLGNRAPVLPRPAEGAPPWRLVCAHLHAADPRAGRKADKRGRSKFRWDLNFTLAPPGLGGIPWPVA